MKRIVWIVLICLLLFTACQGEKQPASGGSSTVSPSTDVPEEPPAVFTGCTNAASCGLNRDDGICSAVILNTTDGAIGLLIRTGTPYEVLNEDDSIQKTVRANGIEESWYHTGDMEVRAEGCVKTEKPADIPLGLGASAWYEPEKVVVLNSFSVTPSTTAKPVIYLYPETETEVDVRLDFAGELTCTYPIYENGWTVTAAPDGTLTDADGQTYRYLYWEGEGGWTPDLTTGFCVRGEDTAAFLEKALADLGLNRNEANEFIIYWLPQMQGSAWNLISFQTTAYTEAARLEISPAPDTLIRVCMAWQPLEERIEIPPQPLDAPARTGFTVVEWGGREVGY